MYQFWLQPWWKYAPRSAWHWQVYHAFNFVEAAAWFLIALLIVWRYAKYRHSPVELLYAAAFVAFGLSDCYEAYEVTSWLILAKGINLLVLVLLRRHILGKYYPASKSF